MYYLSLHFFYFLNFFICKPVCLSLINYFYMKNYHIFAKDKSLL